MAGELDREKLAVKQEEVKSGGRKVWECRCVGISQALGLVKN